jgi:hypothetical protein
MTLSTRYYTSCRALGCLLDGRALVPDFNDPATLGVLTAAVRQVWGDPGAVATREEGTPVRWKVQTAGPWAGPGRQVGYGATEAEALIAALEAATAVSLGQGAGDM